MKSRPIFTPMTCIKGW